MQFFHLALAALVAAAPLIAADMKMQSMYVPLPEEQLLDNIFHVMKSNAESPVNSLISVAISTKDTVVYYDHWEDGYDSDVTGNKQSSTEIWGDEDASNGCAPINGRPCTDASDKLSAGDVVVVDNLVPTPRRSQDVLYDGGDRIQATYPVAMTRAAYPSGEPGSMMAGGVEMIEEANWGISFEAPIGQDERGSTRANEFSAFAVMAGSENTKYSINGGQQRTMSQGESKIIRINQSDTLVTSEPVQVHLITGDIGDTYELRWYSLAPVDQWGTEAYAPVGDTLGAVRVTVYNPSSSSMSVRMTTNKNGQTQSRTVQGKSHFMFPVIYDGYAAKFTSTKKFFAYSSTDTNGGGQIFDWGYPLMTREMLTPEVLIGLGHGCTGNSCADDHGERSIVWVTAVADADIYIDYNNDGEVDETIELDELDGLELTDDDEDMSGAVIWATKRGSGRNGEGVDIAAAWGQKAKLSKSGDRFAMDLGTVVVPFEPIRTSCSVEILEDNDNNGVMSPGDVVEETITFVNVGQTSISGGTIAVNTLGGVVNIEPTAARGGSQTHTTTYTVPAGETVLETCSIVPFEEPPSTIPRSFTTTTDEPMTTTSKPGTQGDPHFKTHGGEMYDFHGGCDLVLVDNPDFRDGLGMKIHIRTKIETWWSYVESAVIQIGDKTIEVNGGDQAQWLFTNGVSNDLLVDDEWNKSNFAGDLLRFKQSGSGREAHIHMGNGEKIMLKSYNQFVKVQLFSEGDAVYHGSQGLLGRFPDGKRVGRDGETLIEDVNAFGQEWQVLAEEPQLFHSYHAEWIVPAGQKCAMPENTIAKTKLRQRRLRSGLSTAVVEKACSHLESADDRKACEYDVTATQDTGMASVW